jgi:hypothetical protein
VDVLGRGAAERKVDPVGAQQVVVGLGQRDLGRELDLRTYARPGDATAVRGWSR